VADRLLTAATHREKLSSFGLGAGSRICVVGAGESAASFALHIWETLGEDVTVSIISPSPPRSRAESYVEDRVYSDPQTAAWQQLPEAVRMDFIARTDRGVISPRALGELAGPATSPSCAAGSGTWEPGRRDASWSPSTSTTR
jgi:mycobactin lysine-N-oxygenase